MPAVTSAAFVRLVGDAIMANTMNTETIDRILEIDFPAAQRGDRDAFARLVRATQRMVASVALAVTRDVQLSEDIAQETFLSAWQRLASMQHAQSFLPWLRQVARNRAIDHVRRRRYQEMGVDDMDQRLASAIGAGPGPEESLKLAQERELLSRALDEIPDDSREVLLLFYREGQSSRHVAALLGLSDGAVRKRLQRARESLQAELLTAVGGAAMRSAPGIAFTTTVASALAAGPGVAKASVAVTAASAGKWLLGAVGSALAAVSLVLAAVVWEVRGYVRRARNPTERRELLVHGIVYAVLMTSFILMLGWSKSHGWTFTTVLFVSFCYSLAIVLLGIRRRHIHRRHRPK